jgi:hypothetical protein
MLSGCLVNLAACSPYVSWKEEVKLNDGRVIVVEQKKLMEGEIDREAWLTISLPEFGSKPIVWHERLTPNIVNIDHGILYVIGAPGTARESRIYECPEHSTVAFVWRNGQWVRIPFDEIPISIYGTNMLIDAVPPRGTSFLTIAEKDGKTLNGEPRHRFFLRLNPKSDNGC